MINLIPPKGHAALKREYLTRVVTVYGFMLAGVLVAGAILSSPTYVLVSSQLRTIERNVSKERSVIEAFVNAEGEIKQANTVISQLRATSSSQFMSEIITEIVRVAPSQITFQTFDASREKGVIKSIQVQGIASSRSELASLKSKLETLSFVKSAAIPISDLAKESDLPFAITVTFASSTPSQ